MSLTVWSWNRLLVFREAVVCKEEQEEKKEAALQQSQERWYDLFACLVGHQM